MTWLTIVNTLICVALAAYAFRKLRQKPAVPTFAFDRYPTRIVECCFGFGVTPIDPGQTVVITKRPQVFFRLRRIAIPTRLSGLVQVEDVRVGKEPMFVCQGSVSGRAFDESVNNAILRPTNASVSQDITLVVTNSSLSRIHFTAWAEGQLVE